LSPPRDFLNLYGPEIRQTTMENFFVVTKKKICPPNNVTKSKKPLIQSSIVKFLKAKKVKENLPPK